MSQQTFNPVNYGFRFTADGWYEFNQEAAIKTARKERDTEARRLTAAGYKVVKFSMGKQLISMGGIGTSLPHIEVVVPVYGLNVN